VVNSWEIFKEARMEPNPISPFRNIPTWIEDDHSSLTPTPSIVQGRENEAPISPITQIALKIFQQLLEWVECWKANSTRIKALDYESAFEQLPQDFHAIMQRLTEYEKCFQERKFDEIAQRSHTIAVMFNEACDKLVQCFRHPTDSPFKIMAINAFIACVIRLKKYPANEDIWNRLSDLTKQLCEAAAPYSLSPGRIFDVNLSLLDLNNIPQHVTHIVELREGLRYEVLFSAKDCGSIIYKTKDVLLTNWVCIPPQENAPREIKVKYDELLSKLSSVEQHFHPRMNELFTDEKPMPQVPNWLYKQCIKHQHYQLIRLYSKVMFASLGTPVQLPMLVGAGAEYFLSKQDSLSKPLRTHLATCDVFTQMRFAKQMTHCFEIEAYFGIQLLKSPAFEVNGNHLYAIDVELESNHIPLPLVQVSDRIHLLIAKLKEEFRQFPHFLKESQKLMEKMMKKLTLLVYDNIPTLQELKKTQSTEEFTKVLQLVDLCVKYDIPFKEVLEARKEDPAKRNRAIMLDIVRLMTQVPRRGVVVPTLRTRFDHIDSEFTIAQESQFIDIQFEQQADLERLIVTDLVLAALASPYSFIDFFSERNLNVFFTRYNPPEDVPYFTEADKVKTNYEYFYLIFWENFINQFASKVMGIVKSAIQSQALYYAWVPEELENYKNLLHNHLKQFYHSHKANSFLERAQQFKLFLDTGRNKGGK
jgi:hypothetical protein